MHKKLPIGLQSGLRFSGCLMIGNPMHKRQPETQNRVATACRQKLSSFQAAFYHPPSFARAGVSPPTTSRGTPLHPAQHQPSLAWFQAAFMVGNLIHKRQPKNAISRFQAASPLPLSNLSNSATSPVAQFSALLCTCSDVYSAGDVPWK